MHLSWVTACRLSTTCATCCLPSITYPAFLPLPEGHTQAHRHDIQPLLQTPRGQDSKQLGTPQTQHSTPSSAHHSTSLNPAVAHKGSSRSSSSSHALTQTACTPNPTQQAAQAAAGLVLVIWCTGTQTTPRACRCRRNRSAARTGHDGSRGSHSTARHAPTMWDAFQCRRAVRNNLTCAQQ